MIVITVGVYWPIREAGFIDIDDPGYVLENVHVRRGVTPESVVWAFTTGRQSNWHPLTWVSHSIDCWLFGHAAPAGHHGMNVALHAINTVLAFTALRAMTGAFWRPLFVAAIFGIHPLHVESVAWISERKDVLSTAFWWLMMISYTQYVRRGGAARYAFTAGCLVLGLLSKPMVVTAPFVLLLLDYWPLNRIGANAPAGAAPPASDRTVSRTNPGGPRARGLLLEKIPLFVLVALSAAVTYVVQAHGGAVGRLPLSHRLATAMVAYVAYIKKTVWPVDLAVLYPNSIGMWAPWQVAAASVALAAVTAVVITLRRRRYLVVGWLWYLGTLVPVIGLVAVGRQSMADRYMYMPMVGLLIMIAWGVADLCRNRTVRQRVASAAAVAAVLTCLALTPMQVALWRDSETLFRHALSVTDRNYVMHHSLARVLHAQERTREAMRHYHHALRIAPRFAKAHVDLGAAVQRQHPEQALSHYRLALSIDPDLFAANFNLAILCQAQGDWNRAARYFSRAVDVQPDNPDARVGLANVLVSLRRLEEAQDQYEQALELDPRTAAAHAGLGRVLAEKGDLDAALHHARRAVAIDPDEPFFRQMLSYIESMEHAPDQPTRHGHSER